MQTTQQEIAQVLLFSDAKDLREIRTGSPQMACDLNFTVKSKGLLKVTVMYTRKVVTFAKRC